MTITYSVRDGEDDRSMPLEPVISTSCIKCAGTFWYKPSWKRDLHPCDCEGYRSFRTPITTRHPQCLLRDCGRAAWVDTEILEDVQALWWTGIWTWVSCQGDKQSSSQRSTGTMARYVGLCDAGQAEAALSLLPWAVSLIVRNAEPPVLPPEYRDRIIAIGNPRMAPQTPRPGAYIYSTKVLMT